jgi:hypothetical protein
MYCAQRISGVTFIRYTQQARPNRLRSPMLEGDLNFSNNEGWLKELAHIKQNTCTELIDLKCVQQYYKII